MRLPSRSYVDRLLKSAYSQHDTKIHFKKYSNTRLTNIYGETIGKSYGEPIEALGYLEMDPTTLRLQELGWDKEPITMVVRFPFIILLEKGLMTAEGNINFSTDDIIAVPHLNKEFQLYKYQLKEPFIGGLPSYVLIGGRKFTNGR